MRAHPLLHAFTASRPAAGPVVVVDECEDTREILGVLFGATGLVTLCAATPGAAAAALGGRRPLVVVTELRGRHAFAPALVDRVRAERALRGAAIVVNSTRVLPTDRAYAAAYGATAFFSKPTDYVALLGCVHELVALRAARRRGRARGRGRATLRDRVLDLPAAPPDEPVSGRRARPCADFVPA